MNETMAQNIYQSGFSSVQELHDAELEDVMSIPGYDSEDKAQKLIDDSTALIDKYAAEGKDLPSAPKAHTVEVAGGGSAKSQAEERLKEEMEQLKSQEAGEVTKE
jgi:hypothetical protein